MINYLGILQNAWSPLYAGGTWPRDSWLKALWRSRSGQRLKVFKDIFHDKIWWDNTTPIVGETPDSVIKPDINHLYSLFNIYKPKVVITFGIQAEKIVQSLIFQESWDSNHLILPHPACRVVTNECYLEAIRQLKKRVYGTVKICPKGTKEFIKNMQKK